MFDRLLKLFIVVDLGPCLFFGALDAKLCINFFGSWERLSVVELGCL